MNRFPALVHFLCIALLAMHDGYAIEMLSSCSAHGIRPQAVTMFCRRCGALHREDVDLCGCGSDDIASMCDMCEIEFQRMGRVPVERAN